MYTCWISCFFNQKDFYNVKLPWWFSEELMKKYVLQKTVYENGRIFLRMSLNSDLLKEISQLCPPSEPGYDRDFLQGQIDGVVNSLRAYKDVSLVLMNM